MKEYISFLVGPVCVLMFLCGGAIVLGTDPWRVVSAVMISRPIAGFVVFSMWTVCWAINVSNVGVHQTRTFKATFYYWHRLAVLGYLVLAAAGSFVVLFGLTVGGLLGGFAR
jgi:NADH:ubiquinone oxidoreductase subunit 2 (subunit N)